MNCPNPKTREAFERAGLSIRNSLDYDFEAVNQVMMGIFEEQCPSLFRWYSTHPESFREQFFGPEGQDISRKVTYTFQRDIKIVGSAGLVQKDPINQPNTGQLVNVYLLPEFRGHGLGRIVVEDLIAQAREIQFSEIYLTTRREFDVAIKLYEKLGFGKAREQKFDGEKSISLELFL